MLLGGGDSGKTTFRKQLRVLYSKQKYTEQELAAFKLQIVTNCLDGINIMVKAAKARFPDLMLPQALQDTADEIELISAEDEIGSEDVFTTDFAQRASDLWSCRLLKRTYRERDSLNLDLVSVNLSSVEQLRV